MRPCPKADNDRNPKFNRKASSVSFSFISPHNTPRHGRDMGTRGLVSLHIPGVGYVWLYVHDDGKDVVVGFFRQLKACASLDDVGAVVKAGLADGRVRPYDFSTTFMPVHTPPGNCLWPFIEYFLVVEFAATKQKAVKRRKTLDEASSKGGMVARFRTKLEGEFERANRGGIAPRTRGYLKFCVQKAVAASADGLGHPRPQEPAPPPAAFDPDTDKDMIRAVSEMPVRCLPSLRSKTDGATPTRGSC